LEQLSNYKRAILAAHDWLQQGNMPKEGGRLWLPNPGGAQVGALDNPRAGRKMGLSMLI